MEIVYLGHSSFRLKGKNGTVITDPYDPKSTGFAFPKDQTANIVTVSHQHNDHNAANLIQGEPKIISSPGEYEIGGISLIGISTYHDTKSGSDRGKNICFIIEIDEIRILHLGDLGHKLSQEELNQIQAIDIVLIPVGGEFTIGPQEAVEVINQLEPRVVIPMHYQVPRLNPQIFGRLKTVDEFLKIMGVAGIKDTKYITSIEKLPEEPIVVVLEPRT